MPFCVSVCPYCDFVVYAGADTRGPRSRMEPFLTAVRAELELRADALDELFGVPGQRPPLASAYLGGGTPSLLPAARVAELLARIERRFGLQRDAEITLEANPGRDEIGDLAGFRAAGVTRLSVGAQSLDAGELRGLGRRHAPEDVVTAVRAARAAGFVSVSVDLLYDVPGQTADSWSQTLDSVLDLPIDHVSAYALDLADPVAEGLTGSTGDHLPVRAGAERWRRRARAAQDGDRAADLYALADARFAAAGLRWYEISNWARPGHESRHNLAYWQTEAYEAVGPGAHAYDGATERRWNAARLDRYLAALAPSDGAPPRLPPGDRERLDPDTLVAERLILGLRLATGVMPPLDAPPALTEALAWAGRHELLERLPDGAVRLNLRGRLLSNEVFARLV
jgi:oxygen-independent coproporphyrinogen-3 oxidase